MAVSPESPNMPGLDHCNNLPDLRLLLIPLHSPCPSSSQKCLPNINDISPLSEPAGSFPFLWDDKQAPPLQSTGALFSNPTYLLPCLISVAPGP